MGERVNEAENWVNDMTYRGLKGWEAVMDEERHLRRCAEKLSWWRCRNSKLSYLMPWDGMVSECIRVDYK